jgi:thiamine-phosphate pyrophosphorylase
MILPRFYPILDSALLGRRGIPVVQAAQEILEAGARILQFRHKGHVTREVWDQMELIAKLCHKANAIFVVNDRADLARLLGAALHIGQDDLPPAAARRVTGKDLAIGFSTHNEDQLRAANAEPVDYIALGPVFGTASKENPDPVVGVDDVRRLRGLTRRPLVAIGGITRGNALSVLEAGADSVAIIGDLYPEDGRIGKCAQEWVQLTT